MKRIKNKLNKIILFIYQIIENIFLCGMQGSCLSHPLLPLRETGKIFVTDGIRFSRRGKLRLTFREVLPCVKESLRFAKAVARSTADLGHKNNVTAQLI